MAIKIQNGDELNRLLDAIAIQVVDANVYFRLLMDLHAVIPDYTREYSQSCTFWYLAIRSVEEACLLRLCRVFDQHKSSLHFVNLLETIKSNRHLFGEANFRERLKGNAFVESLAEDARIPSENQVNEDLKFASKVNPLVDKLVKWRNNVYAHSGPTVILGKDAVLAENPLLYSEIEIMLDKGFEFLNRYLSLFKATTWSRQIVGHDDYKNLFRLIRGGLERHESEIQEQMKRWEKPALISFHLNFPPSSGASAWSPYTPIN